MTIIRLRCPACGHEENVYREAGLAALVIQDHGVTCECCGTLMRLAPIPPREPEKP